MKYSFVILLLIVISVNLIQDTYSKNITFNVDTLIALDSTDVISKENSTEKDSTELIIRKLTIYSGKRPSSEEKENAKEMYWLIRIHFTDVIYASRIIDIIRDGKELHLPFDPVMSFETAEEAIEYARKNGIVDILIE